MRATMAALFCVCALGGAGVAIGTPAQADGFGVRADAGWAEGDQVFWSNWGPNEPAVVLRVKPRFGEVLIESLVSGDSHWVRASDLIGDEPASIADDAAELDLLLNGADAYCALTGNCP